MSNQLRFITSSRFLDEILIIFPLWFPIVYIFLAINFPSSSKLVLLLSLFLFAETHFASTWLFFFDRENWPWVNKDRYSLIYLPLYFAFISIFIWFFSPAAIIIIHYLASGWHVTRQSVGLLKIYKSNSTINKYLIYLFSFIFLAIGLNSPGILASKLSLFQTNFLLFFSGLIYIALLIFNRYKIFDMKITNIMTISTGVLIYAPLLFFKNLAVATAVGVGMHWVQYIAIMWSTNSRKERIKKQSSESQSIFKNSYQKLFFIFSYSLLMTIFAFMGMPKFASENPEYSFIYLIPIVFQFFHFYYDGFIWRFSDPHIKKSISPFLFPANKELLP